MLSKQLHDSTQYPKGTQSLFSHVDSKDHYWYLECKETHKYLAQTQRCEFLAAYRSTLSGPKPVTFATLAQAAIYASIQTSRHRQQLKPRPIADFFNQYIMGQFVDTPYQISIYSTIQAQSYLNAPKIAESEEK